MADAGRDSGTGLSVDGGCGRQAGVEIAARDRRRPVLPRPVVSSLTAELALLGQSASAVSLSTDHAYGKDFSMQRKKSGSVT